MRFPESEKRMNNVYFPICEIFEKKIMVLESRKSKTRA